MRPFRLMLPALALVLSALAGEEAAAQPVSRRDLADAYLLVDRIVAERGMPATARVRWNEDFDRTTLAFFGGDFAKVLRDMHDLAARMLGDSAAASPTRRLLALRLRPQPRVVTPQAPAVRIGVTVMYADSGEAARTLRLRVVDAAGTTVATAALRVAAAARAGEVFAVELPRRALPGSNARLTVIAELDGAATALRAPLFALEAPADSIRAALDAEITALTAPVDAQVLASLRARTTLIADVPDESNSAQFLADPVALAALLQEEIAAVAAGRDPYRRTGDTWRVLQMPDARVPFRLYIPPQARAQQALPVVIALHGAGADENMFLEGYGHGRLRTLADSLGFIAISPATVDFARHPATLDSMLAVVARTQAFDRTRVYMLGHSLGAGITQRFAAQRGDVLRATALIAGAGAVAADQRVVPTLFIAAERDLIIPAARVRAAYDALRARGNPVEFAMAEGWGHTHVVGVELGRALQFLLAR
ncbi:hypothetical protein Strain138_000103 [Pseudogemmatithrix spongiicola]|uniref:Uncharacterized protein n=1 Tax=Pseudogemmatithrix spongiicola TaxID=3062599 RepID=A0AA49Q3G8_9BACT|nr:hypothetical protein Strain138_000103 [Gemmatimonadaceae bacterium 'strain 138']WKW13780.1 hypothetical protein Strain318_000103 [Gemmatimonadaceae bacterium 'strain 318']